MAELSTRPRRRGDIYCSPACGCGCLRSDYEAARVASEIVAKELGRGWQANVWENMGWHWAVRKGLLDLRPSYSHHRNGWRVSGYTAYFNSAVQVLGEGRTARSAVRDALAKARLTAGTLEFDAKVVELK